MYPSTRSMSFRAPKVMLSDAIFSLASLQKFFIEEKGFSTMKLDRIIITT